MSQLIRNMLHENMFLIETSVLVPNKRFQIRK